MHDLYYGLHVYVNVSAGALRGQRCPVALELELETVASCLMWGLGTQLRSSRTVGILNRGAISLSLGYSAAVLQGQG